MTFDVNLMKRALRDVSDAQARADAAMWLEQAVAYAKLDEASDSVRPPEQPEPTQRLRRAPRVG